MKKVKIAIAVMNILLSYSTIVRSQTPAASANQQMEDPLIGRASKIPVNPATSIISISPVILSAPGRVVNLQVRITAPRTGKNLPIIILSHGHGNSNYLSSLYGYGPLADFYAAHGFIVIQPTHLDSKTLKLNPMRPDGPLFWRSRARDIKNLLDQLGAIESLVPEIKGRLDKSRIAIVGHSLGGLTAGMLLGEQNTDEKGIKVDLSDKRIKAGVILSGPGNGGADLNPLAAKAGPSFYNPNFAGMKTPALIIAGDKDTSAQETVRGPQWHADPYKLSPAPKCLLTFIGAQHNLGGISGYDAAEAKDENPERVALIQRLTWTYLRSQLYADDPAWSKAIAALQEMPDLVKSACK
ncbi:alpha/beta hydrolase family protein [Pedobacter hartonius]|uniref:Alpha/beta hydrolase family protein n=1 Tax=Pedobacter hartonius TaxID=425514 RepID=A0A1H4GFG7_9SPHI|nr:alpha/beta fold hydrolase [Pedobacter hartonius]SEB08365.1 Alpha/beta hydrolase family protein [Pedobacter hartonius]